MCITGRKRREYICQPAFLPARSSWPSADCGYGLLLGARSCTWPCRVCGHESPHASRRVNAILSPELNITFSHARMMFRMDAAKLRRARR